eukprot:6116622-Lingulodinium_polyedra.AAC.1
MTMALRQSSGPQTSGASASVPAAAAFNMSGTSGAPSAAQRVRDDHLDALAPHARLPPRCNGL